MMRSINPNFASKECGAQIVETSADTSEDLARAANILVDQPDMFWISGAAPQHVTLRLTQPHPSFRYIGWRVCHDYMTNPKTLVVSSGSIMSSFTQVASMTTKPGAGLHMWALPHAIVVPTEHDLIRIEIRETFGGHQCYLNRIYLFEHEPSNLMGERLNVGVGPSITTAAGTLLTSLLDNLEKDIRKLTPLQAKQLLLQGQQSTTSLSQTAVLAVDTSVVSRPPSPTVSQSLLRRELQDLREEVRVLRSSAQNSAAASQRSVSPPRRAHTSPPPPVTDTALSSRVSDIERMLMSLQVAIQQQGRDIQELKAALLPSVIRPASPRMAPNPPPPSSVLETSSLLPTTSLKRYIETVVTDRVSRHEKKSERVWSTTLHKLMEDRCGEPVRRVVEGHLTSRNPNTSYSLVPTPANLSGSGTARRRDPTPTQTLHPYGQGEEFRSHSTPIMMSAPQRSGKNNNFF